MKNKMTMQFAFVDSLYSGTMVVDIKEYASAEDKTKIEVLFETNDYDEVIEFQRKYEEEKARAAR